MTDKTIAPQVEDRVACISTITLDVETSGSNEEQMRKEAREPERSDDGDDGDEDDDEDDAADAERHDNRLMAEPGRRLTAGMAVLDPSDAISARLNMAKICPSQALCSTKEAGQGGIFAQKVHFGSTGRKGEKRQKAPKYKKVSKTRSFKKPETEQRAEGEEIGGRSRANKKHFCVP